VNLADAEGTIFAETEKSGRARSTSLDTEALRRMFEGEKAKTFESARLSHGLLSKAKQRSEGTKILCDHRARKIAIVVKRFPFSTTELTRILRRLTWEAQIISTDELELILEVIPTKDEADRLRKHRSQEARLKLRDVEQMVLPLALLTRCAARVRLLCIARNARTQFHSTASSLASIRAACSAIQTSAMLREVMMLALELGNFINHGDSSRGAKAITVDSLLTLRDFKTGRMSSLHFLCASMIRTEPDRNAAEVLAKELRAATEIAKVQVQSLQGVQRSLDRDLEVVNAERRNFLHEYSGPKPLQQESDLTKKPGISPPGSPRVSDGEEHDEEEKEEDDDTIEKDFEEDEAMALSRPEDEAEHRDEYSTRWVEDVMKIRGSANRRLRCMQRVVEKLNKLLRNDFERTAEQVRDTLRFCGVTVPKQASRSLEVPIDLEPLLQNLADFIRVFKTHWQEVRADLPSYDVFFGACPASAPMPLVGEAAMGA